jgi:hypothetical protein
VCANPLTLPVAMQVATHPFDQLRKHVDDMRLKLARELTTANKENERIVSPTALTRSPQTRNVFVSSISRVVLSTPLTDSLDLLRAKRYRQTTSSILLPRASPRPHQSFPMVPSFDPVSRSISPLSRSGPDASPTSSIRAKSTQKRRKQVAILRKTREGRPSSRWRCSSKSVT